LKDNACQEPTRNESLSFIISDRVLSHDLVIDQIQSVDDVFELFTTAIFSVLAADLWCERPRDGDLPWSNMIQVVVPNAC